MVFEISRQIPEGPSQGRLPGGQTTRKFASLVSWGLVVKSVPGIIPLEALRF